MEIIGEYTQGTTSDFKKTIACQERYNHEVTKGFHDFCHAFPNIIWNPITGKKEIISYGHCDVINKNCDCVSFICGPDVNKLKPKTDYENKGWFAIFDEWFHKPMDR